MKALFELKADNEDLYRDLQSEIGEERLNKLKKAMREFRKAND